MKAKKKKAKKAAINLTALANKRLRKDVVHLRGYVTRLRHEVDEAKDRIERQKVQLEMVLTTPSHTLRIIDLIIEVNAEDAFRKLQAEVSADPTAATTMLLAMHTSLVSTRTVSNEVG